MGDKAWGRKRNGNPPPSTPSTPGRRLPRHFRRKRAREANGPPERPHTTPRSGAWCVGPWSGERRGRGRGNGAHRSSFLHPLPPLNPMQPPRPPLPTPLPTGACARSKRPSRVPTHHSTLRSLVCGTLEWGKQGRGKGEGKTFFSYTSAVTQRPTSPPGSRAHLLLLCTKLTPQKQFQVFVIQWVALQ